MTRTVIVGRVTDGRVLNAVCRKNSMSYDREHKYITKCTKMQEAFGVKYKNRMYRLIYVSGCFYPYLYECRHEVVCG